ncbi:MAG: hypothetical protein WCE62_18635 [Polyangiales bacterium]
MIVRASIPQKSTRTTTLGLWLGLFALTCLRPPQCGPVIIDEIHTGTGPHDLLERVTRMQQALPPDLSWPLSRPAMPKTLSDALGKDLDTFNQIMRHFALAKDAIGISAFDPNGRGVCPIAPVAACAKAICKRRSSFGRLSFAGAGRRSIGLMPMIDVSSWGSQRAPSSSRSSTILIAWLGSNLGCGASEVSFGP